MMDTVVALAPPLGLIAGACAGLNLSRASVYRQRAALIRPPAASHPRPSPPRSLAVAERQTVIDRLARAALRRPGPRRGLCQPAR